MDIGEAASSPERAFWLLSDATRVAILEALWAASDTPLAFSDLREQLENPDSGQFNYHLNKLRDHFVSKTGEGYELTQAGREVVRAVLAGSITQQPHMAQTSIPGQCHACAATLVVRYDEYGVIECPECGETVMWNEFPPAGLIDRSPEEVAVVFDEWTRNRFQLAMDGICPNCASRMLMELPDGTAEEGPSTIHRCEHCKYEARVPLFGHVIRHPSVVSFFYDMDINLMELPYWEIRAHASEFEETVLPEEPWSASVRIAAADDWIRVTLNDELDVVEVEESAR